MFECWITDLIDVCKDKVSMYSMEVGDICAQTTYEVFDRYFDTQGENPHDNCM